MNTLADRASQAIPGFGVPHHGLVPVDYRTARAPLAIAHRGGAGLAPENTLEAFRRSYALGVRYLETDVRVSADGQLVAFHDARLGRVTTRGGRVRRRSLDELRTLPVLGGGPVLPLGELLAAFPDACFTVDVKEPETIRPLAELLRSTGAARRVCAAAARETWLAELRRLTGPALCTALSWRALARLTHPRLALLGRRMEGATFAHVPLRLGQVPIFTDGVVHRAHDAGIRVLVWTVNHPGAMHRLLDAGVDGIITDRPDLLREVLIARGQWHAGHGASSPVGDLVS